MILQKAVIYGFGKWVDETFDFSNHSFVCVQGENESGKSTLQKFILFILFGMQPKQRDFYRPKTSSKMGGQLIVRDPDFGEFLIERVDDARNGAAVCRTAEGAEYDEGWLYQRLNGMTLQTYKAIFSFSALDLVHIKKMQEEDFGKLLLEIGLTGSKHIHETEKRLDEKMGELFKPYGKNPVINQQLNRLHELSGQIGKYEKEEASYRLKKEEALLIKREINKLQTDLQAEKEKLRLIDKKLQALPSVHEYALYEAKLAALPEHIAFPENGLERMEQFNENIIPLKSELAMLEASEKKYMDKISALEKALDPDLVPGGHTPKILLEKAQYMENKKELGHLQKAVHKLDLQLQMEMDSLHINLDHDDLQTIRLTFQIEKCWQDLKNRLDKWSREKERLQKERQLLDNKQQYIETGLEEIQAILLPDDKKKRLEERLNEHREAHVLKALQSKRLEERKRWEQNKRRTGKRALLFLVGSFVFSMLAGSIGYLTDFYPKVLYNVMIFSLFFGFGQWLWHKKTIRETEKLLAAPEMNAEWKNGDAGEREEAERLLKANRINRNEQALLYEQLKATELELMQWNEQFLIVEQRLQQLDEEIIVQQDIYPFLKQMDVDYWPEFFYRLNNVLKLDKDRREIRKTCEKLRVMIQQYTKDVDQFLAQKNWLGHDVASVEEKLQELESKIEENGKRHELLLEYKKLLAENRQQQIVLQQQIATLEKEKDHLLHIAEVDNENAYLQKARQVQDKEEWTTGKEKITTQFSSIFTGAEWIALLEEKPREAELEVKQEASSSAVEKIERDLEIKRQELANIHAEISQLERSDSFSKTTHQFHLEMEKLQSMAKKWAVFKTAKEMLMATKATYRKKYAAEVMERTANFFRFLTDGAYVNIYAPLEKETFMVESNNRLKFSVNELSQGTIDQLYISLRMAIAEAMSEKYRLPFIIDDAFVHFDSVRTKRIMTILEEISKEQQIILFTCKQEVINAFHNGGMIRLNGTVRIN